MIQNFQTYDLAKELYKRVQKIEVPGHTKDQLLRAAQSVVLNLAEGSAKPSAKDKARFYSIAFGSVREVQAVFDLIELSDAALTDLADHVAACLYRLTYCQKVARKPVPYP